MTRPDRGQTALPGIGGDGRARPRRMRRAVDTQLRALRAGGRLEAADETLVAMARTLADAWDAEVGDTDGSRYTEATLAGRMLAVDAALRGGRDDTAGAVDDELAAVVTAIRNAARPAPPDPG